MRACEAELDVVRQETTSTSSAREGAVLPHLASPSHSTSQLPARSPSLLRMERVATSLSTYPPRPLDMPGAPAAASAEDEAALLPPPPAPSSRAYLARLTLVAALGGLQFGWDTGIAAGMLVALHEDLGHALSATEQGVFVCATTVGAIVGALVAGRLADWRGRRTVSASRG